MRHSILPKLRMNNGETRFCHVECLLSNTACILDGGISGRWQRRKNACRLSKKVSMNFLTRYTSGFLHKHAHCTLQMVTLLVSCWCDSKYFYKNVKTWCYYWKSPGDNNMSFGVRKEHRINSEEMGVDFNFVLTTSLFLFHMHFSHETTHIFVTRQLLDQLKRKTERNEVSGVIP